VRLGKLRAARSAAAARFRWGSGSGSDYGGPLLRGRAREPPPGWAMRPGPALPRTGCCFCWCTCSRSRPIRGMMATGVSERTHHDVAQEGSCANDQDPEWRCLGHRRCGGGRISPARGELPMSTSMRSRSPRRAHGCGAQRGAVPPHACAFRKAAPSPDCSVPSYAPASKSWTARRPIA
jgi:hypothetical protein